MVLCLQSHHPLPSAISNLKLNFSQTLDTTPLRLEVVWESVRLIKLIFLQVNVASKL